MELYGKRLELTSVGVEVAEELLPAYNGDERFLRWSGYDAGKMSLETLQADMQETLSYPGGTIWRITDLAGQLVGAAETVLWPDPESGWIGLLLIRREFQRCGYGSAAAQLLEDYLFSLSGIKKIGLAVLVQNAPALAFWEKRGYLRDEPVKDNHGNEVYRYHLAREGYNLKMRLAADPPLNESRGAEGRGKPAQPARIAYPRARSCRAGDGSPNQQ